MNLLSKIYFNSINSPEKAFKIDNMKVLSKPGKWTNSRLTLAVNCTLFLCLDTQDESKFHDIDFMAPLLFSLSPQNEGGPSKIKTE